MVTGQNKLQVTSNTLSMERHSVEQVLSKLNQCQGYPLFVLAPKMCGQEELLRTYFAARKVIAQPVYLEVDEKGNCVQTKNVTDKVSPDAPESLPARDESISDQLIIIGFVPWLDDTAAERLSDVIDSYIEGGRKVLVFCPLQNDRYQSLQSDRLEITALELLQSGLLRPDRYLASFKQFMSEPLPLQVRLLAMLTVALGHTNIGELRQLNYDVPLDLPDLLSQLHPLFATAESGKGVSLVMPLDVQQCKAELWKVLCEQLADDGLSVTISAVTSRVTALSMLLLQKDDLEGSHQILSIAEEFICRGEDGDSSAGSVVETPGEYSEQGQGDLSQQTGQAQQNDALDSIFSTVNYASRSLPSAKVARWAPLQLRLFGKFEASIEGVLLANKYLSRTKIRRLLAYLALNKQRVVSRDSLIDYLWPNLDFERAQKNLYTSWCMLAKALGSPKVRECQYIQRNGELYQLNSELVECDIHQFEEIARSVLFGQSNIDAQDESLMQLEALYRDALVADLSTDSFLNAKMEHYRSQMVDVLLLTTKQLRAKGEAEKALFCARTAYGLDESREDVYRELMDTQMGAGQRTSAMQTYFSCKRYLSDELGILPSKSTTALYQDVLLDSCR